MIGFKLTQIQAESLFGQEFAPNQYFNPVPNEQGEYFIFDGEVDGCINEDFMWVKELPKVDFELPKQNSIE